MEGRYLLLLRGFSISVPLPRLIFVPQNEWMGLAIHSVASFSENTRSPTHQGRLWFRRYPRTTAGAPEELQLMEGRYLLLLRGFSISVLLPRLIFVPQNEWMGLAIHSVASFSAKYRVLWTQNEQMGIPIHSVASILAKYRVLWTQNEQMGIPIHSVASKQAASQQASSKPASKPASQQASRRG